jgi:hypothetical protein
VSLAGTTADLLVDGSSYGAERRFALRTPLWLLLGPVELAWLAVVAGLVAGPVLLAVGEWIAGPILLVAGLALAVLGARALHGLSRRWIVFVPAGVVLHDPMATADPALFPRVILAGIGPAAADDASPALDLSGGAPGLVLEVRLREAVKVGVRRGRRQIEDVDATTIRFTPLRPGAVMAEAVRRRPRARRPGARGG